MSFLGDIFKPIGKVLGGAAKFAGLIPGVGTLGAALLGGLGGLAEGGGLKGALTGAAEGAAGGLLGKALAHIPGVSKLGDFLHGAPDAAEGLAPTMAGSAVTGALPGHVLVKAATQPEGLGGALKRAGGAVVGAIKSHPDLALAAANTLYGSHEEAKADERLRHLDEDAQRRYQQALGILQGAGHIPRIMDPAQGAQYRRAAAQPLRVRGMY